VQSGRLPRLLRRGAKGLVSWVPIEPRGGRWAEAQRCLTAASLSFIRPAILEGNRRSGYSADVSKHRDISAVADLRVRLRSFCKKHHIRRLEVFGSLARGTAAAGSDVDLLVTLDESLPVSTAELLEMAGEAEELIGVPVDFVLRQSLEKSPNRFARDHILSTAVCVYGD